jgi:hypothetical protein
VPSAQQSRQAVAPFTELLRAAELQQFLADQRQVFSGGQRIVIGMEQELRSVGELHLHR